MLGHRNLRCPTFPDYLGTVDNGAQVILSFHRKPKITERLGTVNNGAIWQILSLEAVNNDAQAKYLKRKSRRLKWLVCTEFHVARFLRDPNKSGKSRFFCKVSKKRGNIILNIIYTGLLFTILFRFVFWTVKAIPYAMHRQVFSIQEEKRWLLGISWRRPRRGLLT